MTMLRTVVIDAEVYYALMNRTAESCAAVLEECHVEEEYEGYDDVAVTAEPDVLRALNAHAAAASLITPRGTETDDLRADYEAFMSAFAELYEEEGHDASDDAEALLATPEYVTLRAIYEG